MENAYRLFISSKINGTWNNSGGSKGILHSADFKHVVVNVEDSFENNLTIGESYNVLANTSFVDIIYKGIVYVGEELKEGDVRWLKFDIVNS